MAEVTYKAFPLILRSKGIQAKFAPDQPPDGTFWLNLNGALERAETAISSRYGNTIINRDPVASPSVGTNNYLLPFAPVTLARLLVGSPPTSYRYAGLSDGSLYRRATDVQGQYSRILSPGSLSGQPFTALVNNSFNSSQPFLYIYDRLASFKDNGIGTPSRIGIFPPVRPATTQNYAPNLTLINVFNSTSGFTTTGSLTISSSNASIFSISGSGGSSQLGGNYERYNGSGSYFSPPDGMLGASANLADGSWRLKFQTNILTGQFDIFATDNAYSASDTFNFPCTVTAVASNATGTIGKTLSPKLDLSLFDPADLIAIVLQVSAPQNVQEIRIQFDVGSSGFTTSFYTATLIPISYQGYLSNPQTSTAVTSANNQTFQQSILAARGSGMGSIVRRYGFRTAGMTEAMGEGRYVPNVDGSGGGGGGGGGGDGSAGTTQLPTAGSWATIYLQKGDFLPVGAAGQQGLDWSNITGWQIQVTTNSGGSSNVSFNSLYIQGGGVTSSPAVMASGPSSYGGVGYDIRYRYFNANTGTPSNGSPPQFSSVTAVNPGGVSVLLPLRQAINVIGQYSSDPQTTHVQIFVRGGLFGSNWFYADEFANVTGTGTFSYKYSLSDSVLANGDILGLANDVPVTATLPKPISTTLTNAGGVGPTPANTNTPTLVTITVADATIQFTPNQIVFIGQPSNLEEVAVVTGAVGSFTCWIQSFHSLNEQVQAFSIPAVPLYLSAIAYGKVWMAGDPSNPHYLYFTNSGFPENVGPQNYIPVGTPSDPITAVIQTRGVLFVETKSTYYQIYPGNPPYAQSTGSKHGSPASFGWAVGENEIWYQCLPEEAEGLTRDGWKKHSELTVGEDVLAYDLNDGKCKWTPVEGINVYDFNGELQGWRSGNRSQKFEFLSTPEHKWVWRPEPRSKPLKSFSPLQFKNSARSYNNCVCGGLKGRSSELCWACRKSLHSRRDKLRSTRDMNTSGSILQVASLSSNSSLLTPREAAILGWIVTDGGIQRHRGLKRRRAARIYQVYTSRYVSVIADLLGDDCISCQDRFTRTPKDGVIRELGFQVSTDYTEYLLTKSGFQSKRDLPSIVCKLDYESAFAMMNAMVDGDGNRHKYPNRKATSYLSQKPGPVMEAFRILCFLCGNVTSRPFVNSEGVGYSRILHNKIFNCSSIVKKSVPYIGKVWCPTTKLGTWVARYNDTISITGNSMDGLRTFRGTDSAYRSLIIEWLYRNVPLTPVPLVNTNLLSTVLAAYHNNTATFIYTGVDGNLHRLIYSSSFQRWRNDDVPVTAILVEPDTNNLLYSKLMTIGSPPVSGYAIVQEAYQDFDDGGWVNGQLVQLPIPVTAQTSYSDQGAPNNQKQYNVLTIDANPAGQTITPLLLFDDNNGNVAPVTPSPSTFTGANRQKFQFQVNAGAGQQAYRASLQLSWAGTVAPEIYQADIYAAMLTDVRSSLDSYWLKFGTDGFKVVKQGYFDITSTAIITVNLYADGNMTTPFYTFTLTANPTRLSSPVRVRFGNVLGTGMRMLRMFRLIATSPAPFQLWSPLQVDVKMVGTQGKGYGMQAIGGLTPP